MCGIVGLIVDAPLEATRARVHAMAERIHHRGPDGGGVAAHPDATLGMKRLAIVDVHDGHQPMANEDESIVIVYNGEVYNAPALRADLQRRGVSFRTRSDTEVILRLYEVDPDRVEEHLVGMWAFAIHDRRRRRLVLSRDRFGIKPLFVARSASAVGFASELVCFDRTFAPLTPCFELDHAAAHAMLSYSYIPETSTMWTGVKRIAPATRLEIDLASRAEKERCYWQLVPSAEAARVGSLDEACTAVDALLRRAVKEHLESDVPVATFLSGGIDSSLVTAYAVEESTRPIEAYSVGFVEKFWDESPFARATAEKIGCPIHVRMLDESIARHTVADAICAYDEPFGDSSSIGAFLISEHIAKDFKVALAGDGGDEVFAGYKKHQGLRLRRPFARVPLARDVLARILGRVPLRTDRTRGWTEATRTLRRISRALEGDDGASYAALTQVAALARTSPLVRVPNDAEQFAVAARERFAHAHGTILQRNLACDLAGPLPNDMLVKVDRASMAHHLEARVPFLDHRVAEFGVGLDEAFTLGQATKRWSGKRVLRTLHERRFGAALANRKKHGFGVPVEAWLRGPLDGACERLFDKARLDRYGVLSSAELGNGGFRKWVRVDPVIAWHAFALAAWCEISLGEGRDAVRGLLRGL